MNEGRYNSSHIQPQSLLNAEWQIREYKGVYDVISEDTGLLLGEMLSYEDAQTLVSLVECLMAKKIQE